MKEKYLETFTNEHGETWWFNYDNKNDMGILWGNDDLIEGNNFYKNRRWRDKLFS